MLHVCCGLFCDAGAFWASVMGLCQNSIREIFSSILFRFVRLGEKEGISTEHQEKED